MIVERVSEIRSAGKGFFLAGNFLFNGGRAIAKRCTTGKSHRHLTVWMLL